MRHLIAAMLLTALVAPGSAASASPCEGPPAAFVGVVYDSAMREDFILDVGNFRHFANALQGAYCFAEDSIRISAFDGSFVRDGYAYPAGTETRFKADLADIGAMAFGDPAMTVFVFLSSHGLVYGSPTGTRCDGSAPAVGSFAALRPTPEDDGRLYDCELGQVLNAALPDQTRTFVAVDCSFCGGFSDSITAVSGTARDDALTATSGIPGPNRVVITGCAITTECFGGDDGGVLYGHMRAAMDMAGCEGYTAPGFPDVQGINVPLRIGWADGACTASEWFFGAVASAYESRGVIDIQEQFRIKYGFADLASDIRIL